MTDEIRNERARIRSRNGISRARGGPAATLSAAAEPREGAARAELAKTLRMTGTPGFVVGDQITTGATDFDGLQALIAKGRSGQTGAK
jgi:hypothetical protein